MKYSLIRSIAASELADVIDAQVHGQDVAIESIAAISAIDEGSLAFWQGEDPVPTDLPSGSCVIARDRTMCDGTGPVCLLESSNPRLGFIRLLQWIQEHALLVPSNQGEIHPSTAMHSTAIIDSGAQMYAGCDIGPGAYLGASCRIGSRVIVGAGSVLGQSGFGYERDEKNVPVRFPHLGNVIVEDGCEIGCNTTIARGSLVDTHVRSNVKIDDQVYIAHNCDIGASAMIAGGAKICGGVVIGSHCWIGAGAMIRQGIEIGENTIVGLGAVVVNSVAANSVVAGNPARLLRERKCAE